MIPHGLHDWPFLDKKIFFSLTVGTYEGLALFLEIYKVKRGRKGKN